MEEADSRSDELTTAIAAALCDSISQNERNQLAGSSATAQATYPLDCSSDWAVPCYVPHGVQLHSTQVHGQGSTRGPFCATRVPSISVPAYLSRIANYAHCSLECFVMALIVVDRLLRSDDSTVLTSLSVHRLMATAILVVAKYHDDVFRSNEYWAGVSGLPLYELNILETEFLQRLGWSVAVHGQQYRECVSELCQRWHLPTPPTVLPDPVAAAQTAPAPAAPAAAPAPPPAAPAPAPAAQPAPPPSAAAPASAAIPLAAEEPPPAAQPQPAQRAESVLAAAAAAGLPPSREPSPSPPRLARRTPLPAPRISPGPAPEHAAAGEEAPPPAAPGTRGRGPTAGLVTPRSLPPVDARPRGRAAAAPHWAWASRTGRKPAARPYEAIVPPLAERPAAAAQPRLLPVAPPAGSAAAAGAAPLQQPAAAGAAPPRAVPPPQPVAGEGTRGTWVSAQTWRRPGTVRKGLVVWDGPSLVPDCEPCRA